MKIKFTNLVRNSGSKIYLQYSDEKSHDPPHFRVLLYTPSENMLKSSIAIFTLRSNRF